MKKIQAHPWVPILLCIAATLALYWPALGHSFLTNWDDTKYVVQNPAVRGFTLQHLQEAFTNIYVGNYAPLQIMSYMLDFELWGLKPSGFIFTNMVIHGVNGALFYLIIARLTGEKVWALPAALIFLLHPVQVESVVWVSQRKNLLAMLFFLASLHEYLIYTGSSGTRRHRVAYILSLAAFLLAIMAKSVVIILPAVLVCFDLCYRNRKGVKQLLPDKVPYLVVALIFGLIAMKSQTAQFQGGRTSYYGGSPLATFLTMLPVLATYLRMVLWPSHLSAWYTPAIRTGIDSTVAWSALLCPLLVLLGVALRRRRDILFWYLLFFIGLLPVAQIVPIVTLMNDRYLYFPMLGGAACLSFALLRDMEWGELSGSGKNIALAVVVLAVVGAYAAASWERIGIWQDSYTLWSDTVRKTPDSPLPHDCLGEALLERKAFAEAAEQFRVALSFEPLGGAAAASGGEYNFAQTHNNLGVAYGNMGMTAEAIRQFDLAIRLKPEYARAYDNLGSMFIRKGLVGEALRSFEAAVRLNPADPVATAHLMKTREAYGPTGTRQPPR